MVAFEYQPPDERAARSENHESIENEGERKRGIRGEQRAEREGDETTGKGARDSRGRTAKKSSLPPS